MTEVLVVGAPDRDLPADLLAYETARTALAPYDVREPYADTVAVETISLGAAVSLLNDLDWYLARVAETALVREPSVDAREWLARPLAEAVRDGRVAPADTGDRLKVYGVADGRLVEPMYVTRTAGTIPSYDLRDVEETLVVRVPD